MNEIIQNESARYTFIRNIPLGSLPSQYLLQYSHLQIVHAIYFLCCLTGQQTNEGFNYDCIIITTQQLLAWSGPPLGFSVA